MLSRLRPMLGMNRRFNVEVAWNLASFGVLAVSGIVINIVIVRAHDKAALGVFNQVFAFYILLTQLAVLGVHFSALKHISHNARDRKRCAEIATAAVVLVAAMGLVIACGTYLSREIVAHWWRSEGVGTGLAIVAPGILFFALNKVYLNILNGLRHMRAYAVFQAARFIFIVVSILVMVRLGLSPDLLAASLTVSETLLLVLMLVYVYGGVLPIRLNGQMGTWIREHARFGIRGFLSGALAEINTRVDVLMLGFLASDALVGIYSFAALIAEGFSQIALVVRRVVDPIIGERFAQGAFESIGRYAGKIRRVVYPAMAAVTIAAVAIYPLGLRIVAPEDSLSASWGVFAILMVGVFLNAGYRPFLGLLLQGGRPGTHTLLTGVLVLSNVVLNAALIPPLGVYGAATATGLVFVLEAVLIAVFARRIFAIPL